LGQDEIAYLSAKEGSMADIRAEVVRVQGRCNAGLEKGDSLLLSGLRIMPEGGAGACTVAFASLVMNAGRLRLREGSLYVCCPDPGTGEGGNVMFELSRVKTDEEG
jgi:uncharacterized repeat protein (TIGR04076 family)